MVAQASPPIGMTLSSAYLLLGAPLAFGFAAVALVLALTRSTDGWTARIPGLLALVLGVVNLGLALSSWPPGADPLIFVGLLVATPILGAFASRLAADGAQLSSRDRQARSAGMREAFRARGRGPDEAPRTRRRNT